jgi:hypothetical protein
MNYDAWRITFQSSEQAAQAAYAQLQQAQEERDALAADLETIISQARSLYGDVLGAFDADSRCDEEDKATCEFNAFESATQMRALLMNLTPNTNLARRDNYKTALGWEDSANTLELMECPKGARYFRESAAKHLRYKAGKLRKQAEANQDRQQ